MTAAPPPAAPAWGPVEDRVLAAVILAAGGPLSPTARAALTDPSLPALGTNDELRLIAALSAPLDLAALPLAALDRAAGPIAARRALRARAALLGLRLGGPAAHASAAVAAALGATPGELLGLQLHLSVALGQRPLPAGPILAAALHELLRPPAWLDGVIDGLGGPLAGAAPPPRRRAGAISPKRYRHPLDAAATAALGRSVAFEEVARRLSEGVPERFFRLENNASRLRVGPDQLPRLFAIHQRCARRLGVDPVPPLYVAPGPLNAWTAGVEQPFVVLHEGAVSGLSEPELEFIIGHELGHILHQHMLYMMVATLLKIPGSVIGSIPVVGPLLTRGVDLALFEWMRKAELSCDRAGLLCCQDPDVALRMMMRLAGLPGGLVQSANPRAFLAQHDALEGQLDELSSRLFYLLSTAGRSHPWVVVRAHELQRWVDEGHYAAILADAPEEEPAAAPAPACPACGAPTSPVDRFCAACGAPLR
ncbi:MAG: hypothetical protein RL071_524 [Pseudomonadota bacterium]